MKMRYEDVYKDDVEKLIWNAVEIEIDGNMSMPRPIKFIYIEEEKTYSRLRYMPLDRPILLPFIYKGQRIIVK